MTSPATILEISPSTQALLEAVGVHQPKDLQGFTPKTLFLEIKKANDFLHLSDQIPSLDFFTELIALASQHTAASFSSLSSLSAQIPSSPRDTSPSDLLSNDSKSSDPASGKTPLGASPLVADIGGNINTGADINTDTRDRRHHELNDGIEDQKRASYTAHPLSVSLPDALKEQLPLAQKAPEIDPHTSGSSGHSPSATAPFAKDAKASFSTPVSKFSLGATPILDIEIPSSESSSHHSPSPIPSSHDFSSDSPAPLPPEETKPLFADPDKVSPFAKGKIRVAVDKNSEAEKRSLMGYIRKKGIRNLHPLQVLLGALSVLFLASSVLFSLYTFLPYFDQEEYKNLAQWEKFLPLSFLFGIFAYLLFSFTSRCSVCRHPLFRLKKMAINHQAHSIPLLGIIISLALHIVLFRWFRCPACGSAQKLEFSEKERKKHRHS